MGKDKGIQCIPENLNTGREDKKWRGRNRKGEKGKGDGKKCFFPFSLNYQTSLPVLCLSVHSFWVNGSHGSCSAPLQWGYTGKMSFSRASWNLLLSCDCMTWLQRGGALFSPLSSPQSFSIYSVIQVLDLNESGKHQMLVLSSVTPIDFSIKEIKPRWKSSLHRS